MLRSKLAYGCQPRPTKNIFLPMWTMSSDGDTADRRTWFRVGFFVVITSCVLIYLSQRQSQSVVVVDREGPFVTPLALFPSSHTVSFPSKNIILRSVYFYPRPREGYSNSSMFLVEIRKKMQHRIVACGAGNIVSAALTVRVLKGLDYIHQHYPHLSHDMALSDCFGLPDIPSGSPAYLWYWEVGGGDLYRVESESPYFVPVPVKTRDVDDDVGIVVCLATVRRVPQYLVEFLRYYKYLGVDHVYMVADEDFIQNGSLESNEFVQRALAEGFVSFSFWHTWLTENQIFYHSQLLGHEDCVYRFQGVYDYALIIDSDDHFIPLVPHQNSLDYYIKKYCTVGACSFQWIEYYPDCGLDWSRLGPHGNVTNTVLSKTSLRYGRWTRKPVYRISATLDVGTHTPEALVNGFRTQNVPTDVAYIAHIRKNKSPPHGLESC